MADIWNYIYPGGGKTGENSSEKSEFQRCNKIGESCRYGGIPAIRKRKKWESESKDETRS
jgi:hypothetical protein